MWSASALAVFASLQAFSKALFTFSSYLASCGRDLAKIFDLVVDLLKYVPMICRKVTHEIRVGEEIIADEIGGKLGVDVSTLDALTKLRQGIKSALILTLGL